MGNRSWFVGIKDKAHLAAVKQELIDVEKREQADWFFRMNFFVTIAEPLTFEGEVVGIERADGTFVYGLLSSDGSGWVDCCNRNVIGSIEYLENLDARFQGRGAPIPGAQYLTEDELIAVFDNAK